MAFTLTQIYKIEDDVFVNNLLTYLLSIFVFYSISNLRYLINKIKQFTEYDLNKNSIYLF